MRAEVTVRGGTRVVPGGLDADVAAVLGRIVERARSTTGAERSALVLESRGRAGTEGMVATSEGPGAVLCAPFRVGDEIRGALYVDRDAGCGTFPDHAESALYDLAEQAARVLRQREGSSSPRNRAAIAGRVGTGDPLAALIGDARPMVELRSLLARVAPSGLPVLLRGPSGSGKELAARAIHALSGRHDGPLVVENCAAFPDSLAESELFGHVRGAFTGATRDAPGVFERADGGTLFLDEIGELSQELQAKLLRVLETGEVRPIGSTKTKHPDFRLVFATNRDLQADVRQGRFREDLYYRLTAIEVELPPLSQRTEDIPTLVAHFVRRESSRSGRDVHVSAEALEALVRRDWPGNVRELANEVARLCALCDGVVEADMIRPAPQLHRGVVATVRTLAEVERETIERALVATGGNRAGAAKLLGISRAKIFERLKTWRSEAPAP